MHFLYKTTGFVLWQLVSVAVCGGCSNPCANGVAMSRCGNSVSFEFNPPVTARNEITVTVSAGDANYTAGYPANSGTGFGIDLQVASYGGVYSMSVATLTFVTPAIVSYSVIADGSVVASATVSPSYQQVNVGGECPDYCPEAVVNVPVTQ